MINENEYRAYLDGMIQGNYKRCEEIVSDFLSRNIEPVELYTGLFQRSLYQVGELWEKNRISVTTEHLATAITERLLAIVYPSILKKFRKRGAGQRAVISCSVNEYHQVGARIVADMLELHGWDVYFLGANTPVNDLLLMIQKTNPNLLGLSLSIYFNMVNFNRVIQAVRSEYSELEIIIGGQAFRWGGADIANKYPRVTYIPALSELAGIL